MAVLKSPKNNRTKKLWARRVIAPIKSTSNNFYPYENQLTKSNLKSFGIKYDFTLDPKKYRFIGDVHKEEKRLLLFAEMKVPGEAWLEFCIDKENVLHQNEYL